MGTGRMEARGVKCIWGGLKQRGTNSTARAGAGDRPWCPLHGVTPVSAVGPHSGCCGVGFGMGVSKRSGHWSCPRGWAGAMQSQGRGGEPPSPPEQNTRGRARHMQVDSAPGIQPRGTHAHSGHASRPPHAGPGTATPARGRARHPHVPTPSAGTELYRAVPSRSEPHGALPDPTGPHRALPDLTGPYRASRARCGAPAHSFIHSFFHSFSHPRRGNEPRAPRAGSAAPPWPRPSPRA